MTDTHNTDDDAFTAMKARAESLERQLHEAETKATQRIRLAELTVEATRVGIIDVDGLRLLDPDVTAVRPDYEFNASTIIDRLRIDKPWLFGSVSSSSPNTVPRPASTAKRMAMDMSVEDWRAARAALLRRK